MKHPRKAKRTRQKQYEKRFAKWFAVGGITFVLSAIGGLFFWYSNQTPPAPVKIYKTIPLSEIKQRQPSTSEIQDKTVSVSHIHHADDVYHHDTVAPEMPTDTIETVRVADAAPTAPLSDSDLTDAELAEIEHAAWHIEIEQIKSKLHALNAEMGEKYPEVAETSHLSPEEIRKRYPTQAAQAALQEKAEQMQEEFLAKISDFMAHLPMDKKIEIIVGVSQNFDERYGDDAADEVTAKLMRSLGL